MSEELPPIRRGGRGAASRARSAARRRRGRAIQRRVAGVSLATLLAASGAVVVQMVSGSQSARGPATGVRAAAVVTSARAHPRAPSRSQTSAAPAVSPSAVTTGAS